MLLYRMLIFLTYLLNIADRLNAKNVIQFLPMKENHTDDETA